MARTASVCLPAGVAAAADAMMEAMAANSSEAVVLRTWPVHEADLVVSFFTRDYGLLKGIAKSALKSRKRFGGALEPMTLTRAWFAEKPRQELVRLDQLEILASPLAAPVSHARLAVLSFFAELLDESLPERDPQETVFRLLVAVLEQMGVSPQASSTRTCREPWMALTYFQLWMTRLMGLLPGLTQCTTCGAALALPATTRDGADRSATSPTTDEENSTAVGGIYFHPHQDGLFCSRHRGLGAQQLSADSWQLAQRMLRAPVGVFVQEPFPRRRGQDLRRFTLQSLERHLERWLRTAEALARL